MYLCCLLVGMKSDLLNPILLALLWGMDRILATSRLTDVEIVRVVGKGKLNSERNHGRVRVKQQQKSINNRY